MKLMFVVATEWLTGLATTVCHAATVLVVFPVGPDRGDGTRPDGVTVFIYCREKSLCSFATCVDTFSETSVIRAAIESGSPAAGTRGLWIDTSSDRWLLKQ